MTNFSPKKYQSQVLESVEAYFTACHELPSPSIAYTATTERLWGHGLAYNPLSGFPSDMPYFCLRVPTGGGKTWLAAKSVQLANTHLLRCEHSVILWLVPSKPIRDQTLRALRDRQHPYHAALREAGGITVMDMEEAKSVTRATLDTSTAIIVATRQAFQVEDEECRKVYQSSGALMHHFEHLAPAQRDELLKDGQGADQTTPYSLANVLRLRRPFVIVDEAHNSRTELAFDMLARLRPSGVMELTATPDLERTPSNVLHSVSAAELKAEEIIVATGEEKGLEKVEASRTTAIEFFQTPAELGQRFRIPQLAVRVQGELQLFDDPEVLEYPWELSPYDAAPTADNLVVLGTGLKASEGGEIDVDAASGRVVSRFLPELQRDLGLAYRPEHWDEVRLATWLCKNLPEERLTHASKQAFVAAWLSDLLRREDFTLARVNLQKFQIRNLIEAHIRDLRRRAVGKAFQQALFGDDAASRVAVTDLYAFDFHPQAYAPSRDYDGRFGPFDFRKHYYGRMGDFDSREEFECACWLDMQAQRGRIQFWVRNLVRREGSSFFLQKSDGRFYPDFLCQLPGAGDQQGAVLAIEYKGADRWTDAGDDRLIGGLWVELSNGRCRFAMVKDKRWDWIEGLL